MSSVFTTAVNTTAVGLSAVQEYYFYQWSSAAAPVVAVKTEKEN